MGGLPLLRIRGIDVRVHWSLTIIVLLVAASVAAGEVPQRHPGWSEQVAWIAGIAVGVGLVVSIALHELAHSLVAQRVGVPVPRITLFAFGGMAQLGDRPHRASHEFAITAVGPLTSFALGVGMLAVSLVADAAAAAPGAPVVELVARLLGQINLALAIFNCLPGAPLDGGRILHSLIWRATSDERRATELASLSGRLIGFGLAAVGCLMLVGWRVPWFGTGAGGVWLVLIGWFIAAVARAEVDAVAAEDAAAAADATATTDDTAHDGHPGADTPARGDAA